MKFFWGLLAGFALGAAVGLLLAPQPGQATISQLAEQGVMLRNRSGSLTNDLRSRANQFTEDMRTRANDAMAQGREMYARTKDDLGDRYSKAKSGEM